MSENGHVTVRFENGESVSIKKGEKVLDAINMLKETPRDIFAININNRIHSVFHPVIIDSECELITYGHTYGKKMYEISLKYIFLMALHFAYPEYKVRSFNKIGRNMFFNAVNFEPDEQFMENISLLMHEIINAGLPIIKETVRKEEAKILYEEMGYECHIDNDNPFKDDYIVYYCDYDGSRYYNYLYDRLVPYTSCIKEFDVRLFKKGILLMMPDRENPYLKSDVIETSRITDSFDEFSNILGILNINYVSDLNNIITNDKIHEVIQLAELDHSNRLFACASEIAASKTRVVLIAGPSSSGKTTFAKKLEVQLRLLKKRSLIVSMDDYFYDFKDSPLDETGSKNFDSINHLDIGLFRQHMTDLLEGRAVSIPKYNFRKNNGEKEYLREPVAIQKETIIIAEGIHALNPKVSDFLSQEMKFKIYVAPMVTLSYDSSTKVSSNITRLVRRVVRDYMTRGALVEDTFLSWGNVKQGELENIFPFVDDADVIYNTNLVYEISALKPLAENILRSIDVSSKWYYLAKQIYQTLQRFESIDTTKVPMNSILREFIGGGYFRY